MSCFSPNFVRQVRTDNGLEFSSFGGRLTQRVLDSSTDNFVVAPVPCGRCSGCRLDNAHAWADRMLLEYEYFNRKAIFLTLTYDDDHVPTTIFKDTGETHLTLQVRDMQLFNKKFRRDRPPGLTTFYCGEYGSKTFRPHYHEIIFGVSLDDFDDLYFWSSKKGINYFISPSVMDDWDNRGNVLISDTSYATFGYVARYTMKKVYSGESINDFYKYREAPFIHMSHGLGLKGFDLEKDDFTLSRYVSDGSDVHKVGIPRVILEKIHLTRPELYDNIKTNQIEFAESRRRLIEDRTDLSFVDYLHSAGRQFDNKVKTTKERNKEL